MEPNGLTLLFQSAGHAANPAVYKKLPHDTANTLIDVGLVGATQYGLVTSPTTPLQRWARSGSGCHGGTS